MKRVEEINKRIEEIERIENTRNRGEGGDVEGSVKIDTVNGLERVVRRLRGRIRRLGREGVVAGLRDGKGEDRVVGKEEVERFLEEKGIGDIKRVVPYVEGKVKVSEIVKVLDEDKLEDTFENYRRKAKRHYVPERSLEITEKPQSKHLRSISYDQSKNQTNHDIASKHSSTSKVMDYDMTSRSNSMSLDKYYTLKDTVELKRAQELKVPADLPNIENHKVLQKRMSLLSQTLAAKKLANPDPGESLSQTITRTVYKPPPGPTRSSATPSYVHMDTFSRVQYSPPPQSPPAQSPPPSLLPAHPPHSPTNNRIDPIPSNRNRLKELYALRIELQNIYSKG
jgi:hypothetical protein